MRVIALALLALTTSAIAQNTATENTQRIQPMSQDAQTTAFFYQKPVVLDREQHKDLRLEPGNALFAAQNQAVPLLAAEFAEACLEYPIAFAKGQDGQWLALALTGLTPKHNAFVDAKGQWNARYVPASVRRYPFILAESGKDQLSLAIDMAAPGVGKKGQALFDDKGEPTDVAKSVLQLLADFQSQAKLTSALAHRLDEAGLLTQQNLQVRQGEEQQAVVEGVWIVDETKLRQLPDDKVLAWFKDGQLAAIHAHMLSLRNLVALLQRSHPGKAHTQPTKPGKKAKGG